MVFKKKSAKKEPIPVEAIPEPVAVEPQPVPVPVEEETKPTGWILQDVQSTASTYHNPATGEYIDDREVLLRILNTLESFKED